MTKPVIHGRDHAPGGSDPIPNWPSSDFPPGFNGEGGYGAGGPWVTVSKTADTTINLDASYGPDPHLFFTSVAGRLYEVELFFVYVSLTTTPGVKVQLGEDTIKRGVLHFTYITNAQGAGTLAMTTDRTNSISFGTTNGLRAGQGRGWYLGGGGVFQFLWAQAGGTAEDTTVKAGSYLRYRTIFP